MAGEFKARDVMERAGIVLSDESGARWKFTELRLWINDGLREIATLKPTATSKNVLLNLQAGTFQRLEANLSDTDPVALIRAVRNLKTNAASPRVGGAAVRNVSRIDMDAMNPDWHDDAVFGASKAVSDVIYDDNDPLNYYVFPPNLGTGYLEAVVGFVPAETPEAPSPDSRGSYSAVVDLKLIYFNALLDYVLFRCYAKEAEHASSGNRAMAHYQAMANSLGVKLQNEKLFAASRVYAERT